MGWRDITDAEMEAGRFARPVADKLKDNFEYLYGALVGKQHDPPNGSFEIDSDGDGVPDSWSRELYSGGSGGIETTSPLSGAQAVYFTHPGGAGNGGGLLDSDYMEIGEVQTYALYFMLWATAAGIKIQVRIRYYTAAQVYISDYALYSSTSNPTSPTLKGGTFTPPANARYCKIRLIGGLDDTDVAGTVYFDRIERVPSTITTALKTVANTTGASGSVGVGGHVSVAMQDHCFAPNIYTQTDSFQNLFLSGHSSNVADTTARIGFSNESTSGGRNYAIRWRYITASDRPFVYAVRNAEGEIICLWACDDPPPGYWGFTEKPADFIPPIAHSGGIPEGAEEIVLFDQERDFVMELGEKATIDKTLPFRVLSDIFEFDSEKKLFKSKNLLAV